MNTRASKDFAALFDVVGDIYEAALQPELLSDVLVNIANIIDADKALIFSPNPSGTELHKHPFVLHNWAPDAIRLYDEYFHLKDIMALTAIEKGLFYEGSVVLSQQYIPEKVISKGHRKLSTTNMVLSFCNGKEKQVLPAFPNRREDFSAYSPLFCA